MKSVVPAYTIKGAISNRRLIQAMVEALDRWLNGNYWQLIGQFPFLGKAFFDAKNLQS
jgi:hypothetical protein